MRLHAARFGAAMEIGRIERLERRDDGTFDATAGTRTLAARFVLLATGARDVEPAVAGLQPALKSGQVRYCPVCDGFETQGQRVAVLGPHTHGLKEAMFLSDFGNQVTWLSMGTRHAVPATELARLQAAGVQGRPAGGGRSLPYHRAGPVCGGRRCRGVEPDQCGRGPGRDRRDGHPQPAVIAG